MYYNYKYTGLRYVNVKRFLVFAILINKFMTLKCLFEILRFYFCYLIHQ